MNYKVAVRYLWIRDPQTASPELLCKVTTTTISILKEPIDAREKQLESSSSKIILVQNSMRFYFLRNNLDDSSLGYEILFRIAGVRINFSLICWEKTNKKIKSD